MYKKKVVSKLYFGKRFVASLWCTVVPVQWIESARERARNWDKAKKEEAWKEKEEKTGGKGKEKEVFKWVCGKAGWHWNRHAPSHNGRDINFSTLSVSPLPSLFLSLPLSFPPSALPLHLASSRSLTPFPLFHSFSLLRSSFLFLFCLHHPTLLFLPALFLFCDWIVLSLFCVSSSICLFSPHLTAFPSLLTSPSPPSFSLSADFFSFYSVEIISKSFLFFNTHSLVSRLSKC